ncbi:hypothetical protein C1J05_07400 [Sulfitobacter sp. JL08]|uniref:glycosyltransferase n=1 Tax=Sulfitobacter sp. JL08 TaxID=2070369 RepID=UPI000E0BCFF4|nr:glycosyltransferase [Sulfitobacter sp. JL08]AXI54339.1 hypothetical protein C1J05_07400 [Sulfitobacter sp. JL08]
MRLLPTGGATIVAQEVALALVRQSGWRITAVSVCQRADLLPYALIKTETRGIVNYLINLPEQRSYAQLYDNPQVTSLLAGLMGQLAPDLVHAHCLQDIGTGIIEAAALNDVPVVLSVHDFWWLCDRQFMIRPDGQYCGQQVIRPSVCRGCVEHPAAARFRSDLLHRRARNVDLITYPSRFARDLSEKSGFAPGKGVVWENGVTAPKADFFARQAARRARDPRVAFGFLGGPSQIKGWPLIRQVFSDLPQTNLCGHLVDGSLNGSWWKGHDLAAIGGDWQIHPRFDQDGLDAFYEKIDVLLFLSQWKETFGLAIREALCRGIRVIQTDSGGTTEHGAVDRDALIPIGPYPDALRAQIENILEFGIGPCSAHPVRSYGEQAAEFAELVQPLLQKTRRAPKMRAG